MATTDDFETAQIGTTVVAGGTSVTDDAKPKFYQVSVPNFTESDKSTAVGASFLRLGTSFVKSDMTVDQDLTGNPVPSVQAALIYSNELAKLIGDARGIDYYTVAAPGAAAEGDSAGDPILGEDPSYFLGFSDDSRARDHHETRHYKQDERKKETKKLLTKGGWWDHSDGNRISTTKGDKVEIVEGNYKMIVLGRLPHTHEVKLNDGTKSQRRLDEELALRDAGEVTAADTLRALKQNRALVRDISGGLLEENGPSPTHCIKSIEWVKNESNWEVYQSNGIGDVYSTFYGKVKEEFYGTKTEVLIGVDPDNLPDEKYRPPGYDEEKLKSLRQEFSEKNFAKTITLGYGSERARVDSMTTTVWAKRVEEVIHADVILRRTESITQNEFYKSNLKTDWFLGNRLEMSLGNALSVFLALPVAKVEVLLGIYAQINLGMAYRLTAPLNVETNLGANYHYGIQAVHCVLKQTIAALKLDMSSAKTNIGLAPPPSPLASSSSFEMAPLI